MFSRTSGHTWSDRASSFVSFGLLACVSVLSARQPAGAQSKTSDTPPSAIPEISAAQAAVGSTPTSQNPKQSDAADATKGMLGVVSMVQLGPGDLIEVNVYNVPELTTKARVNNSGDLYLPLIDYVHVEGLTLEEAQALVEKRLADGGFVRSPHVTIFVDEAASQGVTLLGEVGRPGIYPDTVDRKLYEVISEAGGFTQIASRKIAIIRRNQSDPIRIDLPRNLADDLSGNVEVLPGDTINVPKAPIIYVVGDVARPSGLLVDNGALTVLQALALAGGANHTAKLSSVRLIRKTSAGATETKIQLKKMLEAKLPDLTLQADDILFVPISGARVLAGATFGTAMAAATAVAVYSVRP
jgi:polysaccharide biosynthesis/export protein